MLRKGLQIPLLPTSSKGEQFAGLLLKAVVFLKTMRPAQMIFILMNIGVKQVGEVRVEQVAEKADSIADPDSPI